jgi:hypothetical protein
MPIFTSTSVTPRQELAMAIIEGEGAIGGLVGPKILPDFPINRRTAHIIKATLASSQGLRHIAADKYIRAPGTKFERLVATLSDDTFTVTLRGVEIVVPNESSMDYDGYLALEQFYAARFGTEVSGLTKEYLIAAAIFSTANFGAATNSTVAYTAANLATISFISDIIASTRRLKGRGEPPPYVAVMSGPVFERVRQATTVQLWNTGTLRGQQEATLANVKSSFAEFGISDILIGDAYYNSAADGATAALSQIWSNTYIWVGRPGMAQGVGTPGETSGETGGDEGVGVPMLGGVGADIYWEGFTPGGVPSTDKDSLNFAGGNYVESYPDLSIDSTVLRLKMSNQPYIGNGRAGDLIATQYS